MFAYARNMQLALTDKLRRAGLTVGAGLVLLIGLGFLLAALWTWLAHHLGWGALGASAAIGGAFVLLALVMAMIARKERHPTPTTEDLKSEVEAQVNQMADAAIGKVTGAADAALDRVSERADRLMGRAGQKLDAADSALRHGADRYADRAEAEAARIARRAGETLRQRTGQGASSLTMAAPLIGALAVGITLASRLRRKPERAEFDEDWEATGDWDDDPYRRD